MLGCYTQASMPCRVYIIGAAKRKEIIMLGLKDNPLNMPIDPNPVNPFAAEEIVESSQHNHQKTQHEKCSSCDTKKVGGLCLEEFCPSHNS